MATCERHPSVNPDSSPFDNFSKVMNALSAQLLQAAPQPVPHTFTAAQPLGHQAPQRVHAKLTYTKPTPSGEELYSYVYALPDGQQPNNLVADEQQVQINDLHTAQRQFSLQRSGFQLEKLAVDDDIDWDSDEEVQRRYYPAVVDLIKRTSGASDVHVFDHTIRRGFIGEVKKSDGRTAAKRTPVSRVHVDYNTLSGVNRLHQVLPDEAAARQKKPFAVIQVWKPLKGPVKSSPLAMIDASTVAKDDYMDLRLQFEARTGYNYALKYNSGHQWYFAKDMQTDEAYVFTCYNSRNDRARFTPHTGFEDPTTPADAPPRESIEIRAYAFWGDEPDQPIASDL